MESFLARGVLKVPAPPLEPTRLNKYFLVYDTDAFLILQVCFSLSEMQLNPTRFLKRQQNYTCRSYA